MNQRTSSPSEDVNVVQVVRALVCRRSGKELRNLPSELYLAKRGIATWNGKVPRPVHLSMSCTPHRDKSALIIDCASHQAIVLQVKLFPAPSSSFRPTPHKLPCGGSAVAGLVQATNEDDVVVYHHR